MKKRVSWARFNAMFWAAIFILWEPVSVLVFGDSLVRNVAPYFMSVSSFQLFVMLVFQFIGISLVSGLFLFVSLLFMEAMHLLKLKSWSILILCGLLLLKPLAWFAIFKITSNVFEMRLWLVFINFLIIFLGASMLLFFSKGTEKKKRVIEGVIDQPL